MNTLAKLNLSMHQDKLRRLLNSLSESEIKFFRQYARRHLTKGDAIYLKLFDVMIQEKDDDDKRIRNKLHSRLSGAGYMSLKKYLYELVLKTLVILREESSFNGQMLKELAAAEILAEKQLYEDAVKKLTRIQSLTQSNELSILTLVAMWFEEIIMRTTGYTLTNSHEISNRHERLKMLVHEIQAQINLGALFAGYGNLNQTGVVKSEERKNLQSIFDHPLLGDAAVYSLPSARRTYWIMKVLKARYAGDRENSKELLKKIYSLVKHYPANFYYHEYLLIFSHYMLILSAMENSDFKRAETMLRKLKSMEPLSNQNNYLLFRLSFLIELAVLKSQKKDGECLSIIMKYDSRAKDIRGRSFNIMEYRNYQAIISYLMSRKLYSETLPFINSILNDKTARQRGVPYQIYARMMNLIVHFELKNFDLIESDIRGLNYFINKNRMESQSIRQLLKFFRSITRPNNRFENSLSELGRELNHLIHIPAERIHLYDLIDSGWFQQKGLLISIPGPRPMVM